MVDSVKGINKVVEDEDYIPVMSLGILEAVHEALEVPSGRFAFAKSFLTITEDSVLFSKVCKGIGDKPVQSL